MSSYFAGFPSLDIYNCSIRSLVPKEGKREIFSVSKGLEPSAFSVTYVLDGSRSISNTVSSWWFHNMGLWCGLVVGIGVKI